MSERFQKIRDASHVQRWHTKRSIHRQTVGEHTFGVVAIILHLWPYSHLNLIKAAMWHDIPEIATGDIPAPTKRKYPDLNMALQIAEHEFMVEHGLYEGMNSNEINRLKLADLAELVLYAHEEMQAGNKTFKVSYSNGVKYIHDMVCDEADKARVLGFLVEMIETNEAALYSI
jgi:5'-deoxynucleotidase YfbR-like HD superfamily hydrolase